MNLGQKLRSSEKKWPFFLNHPVQQPFLDKEVSRTYREKIKSLVLFLISSINYFGTLRKSSSVAINSPSDRQSSLNPLKFLYVKEFLFNSITGRPRAQKPAGLYSKRLKNRVVTTRIVGIHQFFIRTSTLFEKATLRSKIFLTLLKRLFGFSIQLPLSP